MFRSVGKFLQNSFARIDKPLLICSLVITLMSLVTIYGARENFEKAINCRFTSVITVTRDMVQAELDSLQ